MDLSQFVTRINELYDFRKSFVRKFAAEQIGSKDSKTEDILIAILNDFDQIDLNDDSITNEQRSEFYYLKGRAYNILLKYNDEAEKSLSKAIKLNRKSIEAWNELAECFYKRNNNEEAKRCFHGALLHKRNKVSLRSLSMLSRYESTRNPRLEAKKELNELGVKLALEAVQLDDNDGYSWMVLGNSYLSMFIVVGQNRYFLTQALSAYSNADKDDKMHDDYDLYLNWATACFLEEEYENTLKHYKRTLELEPTCSFVKSKTVNLIDYLNNLQNLIDHKGKLKTKRLQQMLQKLNQNQVGSYAKKLDVISLQCLQIGPNVKKIVVGKVVCSVKNDENIPFTFCLMDDLNTCCCVTVYNLASGKGVIIGDTVAIPEPIVKHIQFTFEEKTYNFKSIRVDSPLKIVINGKFKDQSFGADIRVASFKREE